LTLLLVVFIIGSVVRPQDIATLEYGGGGDWYANPSALPNLIKFCNENIHTKISAKPQQVKAGSIEIFNYPIVFIKGHGNMFLDDESVENLRNYMISGGFIHISDNYGLDSYVRREFKKIFPNMEFQEVPYDHPIFHQTFDFPTGVPKIHVHDGKPPKGYGLFYEGQLVCFYDYESDLSDGWESQEVHNDPLEVRLKALKMGANLIEYVFTKNKS
jgi:hypothetical protein